MNTIAQDKPETRHAAALALARDGWPVFPIYAMAPDGRCWCEHEGRCEYLKGRGSGAHAECPAGGPCAVCKPGKHPATRHGHCDASTDEDQIRTWWEQTDWNVGIAVPEGVVIVDIDPRNGGNETLAKACDEHGDSWLYSSLAVSTGGGGLQVYLACEPGRRFPKTLDAHFGPGIDLKQCGGYVLAPPSNHKSGGTYEWLTDPASALASAPAWLTLLSKTRAVAADVASPSVPDGALDEDLCARLDKAVEAIEPYYVHGVRHDLAVAIGGYLRNRKLPKSAARYVVSRLPSANPNARVKDAEDMYHPDIPRPAGASDLRALASELLAELDALGLDPKWIRQRLAGGTFNFVTGARDVDKHADAGRPEASLAFTRREKKRRRKPTGWVKRPIEKLYPAQGKVSK